MATSIAIEAPQTEWTIGSWDPPKEDEEDPSKVDPPKEDEEDPPKEDPSKEDKEDPATKEDEEEDPPKEDEEDPPKEDEDSGWAVEVHVPPVPEVSDQPQPKKRRREDEVPGDKVPGDVGGPLMDLMQQNVELKDVGEENDQFSLKAHTAFGTLAQCVTLFDSLGCENIHMVVSGRSLILYVVMGHCCVKVVLQTSMFSELRYRNNLDEARILLVNITHLHKYGFQILKNLGVKSVEMCGENPGFSLIGMRDDEQEPIKIRMSEVDDELMAIPDQNQFHYDVNIKLDASAFWTAVKETVDSQFRLYVDAGRRSLCVKSEDKATVELVVPLRLDGESMENLRKFNLLNYNALFSTSSFSSFKTAQAVTSDMILSIADNGPLRITFIVDEAEDPQEESSTIIYWIAPKIDTADE